MQTQTFNIEIKNEKINTYRMITLLIVILNILIFGFLLFDSVERRSALLSLLFISSYAVYRFYVSKKNKKSFFFDEWIFFLLMILWVDKLPVAIINMILFLLYTITIQKIIYNFDTSFIKQKCFPWKQYQWSELSNVILKDNLLTIDFRNNKLMQAEIISRDIDEKEFNAFAKARLSQPDQ